MEAIGHHFLPAKALAAACERRDRTYDPSLADLFAVVCRASGLAANHFEAHWARTLLPVVTDRSWPGLDARSSDAGDR